jgi:outer membrane protein TolC
MHVAIALLSLMPFSVEAQEAPAELSLSKLIEEALEHNPAVREAAQKVEAKRARVAEAAALPDPMLMYGVINEGRPIPFQTLGVNGFSEVYVGVSQEFPYPGKRGLRQRAAEKGVEAAEREYESLRRRLTAEVAGVYYDLCTTHVSVQILADNVRLLDELIKVANARFAVGQASQQDVLGAEVEMSRLEEQRSELSERRTVLEAQLSRLLFRHDNAPYGAPLPIDLQPIPGTLEDLLREAEGSPVLDERVRLVAQAQLGADLAVRGRKPDFGVNFTYHNRGALDPYWTFGGTLTLPNLHGRQDAAIEESVAELGASRSAADMARADVRYEVTEAYSAAATSERLLKLYDEGLLKQARLSLDSAMSQYRVGKVDFLTLVTSWRRLLDYDLGYQEQLAAHEKALARLAVHLGSPTPAEH